jgi:hypothetical protein
VDGLKTIHEDSMKKVMCRQASHNLDYSEGNSSTKSFLRFPNSSISTNLQSAGVAL